MTMKKVLLAIVLACGIIFNGIAQSVYGDAAVADVKVKYLNSLPEALEASAKENKPVFFNCFADWAVPCHAMNKLVFSDADFAKWLNDNFVCLCLDVSNPAYRNVVSKYRIRFFAHFLILDSKGNILHRIVGGSKLPEFKELVARGLDPDRCLAGMDKRYEAGDKEPEFLRDYIGVLRTADLQDKRDLVTKEYVSIVDSMDLTKRENWSIFTSLLSDASSERFPFLLRHYDVFVKESGYDIVEQFVGNMYIRELIPYLFDNKGYGELDIKTKGQEMNCYLADTNDAFTYLALAKARGEKRYLDFIKILKEDGDKIQWQVREGVDLSVVKILDDEPELKPEIEEYLNERMSLLKEGTSILGEYKNALKQAENAGGGVKFEDCGFAEILAKAKKENKLVFMDCYTVWCGPCKMLSSQVFPLKTVGDFFNAHFVNIKMDMERGEGKNLAKRYNVKVFPTLLILDAEGNLQHRFTGLRAPQILIAEAKRALSDSTAYGPVKAKYEAGDRTPVVVTEYLKNLVSVDGMTEEEGRAKAKEYFDSLSEDRKMDVGMLAFYSNFAVGDPKGEMASYFLKHHKKYKELAGKERTEKVLLDIYFPVLLSVMPNPDLNDKDLADVVEAIEAAGCVKEGSTLGYFVEILKAVDKQAWTQVLKIYKGKVAQMDYEFGRRNLDLLWKRLWSEIPTSVKKEARTYIISEKEQASIASHGTYDALLEFMK